MAAAFPVGRPDHTEHDTAKFGLPLALASLQDFIKPKVFQPLASEGSHICGPRLPFGFFRDTLESLAHKRHQDVRSQLTHHPGPK